MRGKRSTDHRESVANGKPPQDVWREEAARSSGPTRIGEIEEEEVGFLASLSLSLSLEELPSPPSSSPHQEGCIGPAVSTHFRTLPQNLSLRPFLGRRSHFPISLWLSFFLTSVQYLFIFNYYFPVIGENSIALSSFISVLHQEQTNESESSFIHRMAALCTSGSKIASLPSMEGGR